MDGDRHVVLIGLPGAGKTSIGRRLARLLHRPFADADEQLELAAGRTIARLARERGADDLHRREAAVLADLLAQDGALVILAPGAIELDSRSTGPARPVGGRAVAPRTGRGPRAARPAVGPLRGHRRSGRRRRTVPRRRGATRTSHRSPHPAAPRHGRAPRPGPCPRPRPGTGGRSPLRGRPGGGRPARARPIGPPRGHRRSDRRRRTVPRRRRRARSGHRSPHRPPARGRRPSSRACSAERRLRRRGANGTRRHRRLRTRRSARAAPHTTAGARRTPGVAVDGSPGGDDHLDAHVVGAGVAVRLHPGGDGVDVAPGHQGVDEPVAERRRRRRR